MIADPVSVVIPVWNGRPHLRRCLDALQDQVHPDTEIIAVDNGSTDCSADFIAEHYPWVHLIRNERNLGFAGGCNVGLRMAQGSILVLLNQDTMVQPGWLDALIRPFADQRVGVVGAKILEPDGRTLSHVGGYLEWPLALGWHVGVGEVDRGQYDEARDVEYVTGASLAIRRAVVAEIGMLDERFFPAFYEDVDLCWRARQAGWTVRYQPGAVVLHDEASSTRHHWPSRHYYHYRNRLLFLCKHFTPAQIVEAFFPAERERIARLSPEELRAGQVALVEILAMWPIVITLAGLSGHPDQAERLREVIRSLRTAIVQRQGGDPALARPRRLGAGGGAEPVSLPQSGLPDPLADELDALWEVEERPFTSDVPIVGRWIVAFRRLWNSVATRWYVLPLLSQQVQFNGAVVRALRLLQDQSRRLHAHYWDDDALLTLLAERCGDLAAQMAELEARLEGDEGLGLSREE